MAKYTPDKMIAPLRLFVRARREALDAGFTDNGGAIRSVERILDILALRLCYPHLSHLNNYKGDPNAERSRAADAARRSGQRVLIEHVASQRALARQVCELIERGAEDKGVFEYIRRHYRLVLLTPEETQQLNRVNRSCITSDRIAETGIQLHGEATRRRIGL